MVLDPQWASWSQFTTSFHESFASGVLREESVVKWDKLTHTADGGIDLCLDQVVQLMWKTGYSGAIVNDKISNNLHNDLKLESAQVASKPGELADRIKMLRRMCKIIEEHQKHAPLDGQWQVGRKEHRPARQPKTSTTGTRPSRPQTAASTSSGNKATERKDGSVELRGIPDCILVERKQVEVCLKCGEGNHTWYECWTKAPVTARVAGVQRGLSRKRTREDATSQSAPKKGKVAIMQVSPIGATVTLEDRIMMPVDEDSDPEIY